MELDLARPAIPAELVPAWANGTQEYGRFHREANIIWEMVCSEVLDEEYLSRSHQNAGTYDAGCRGPLCRKSYREHPRRKRPLDISILTPQYERAFDPILEYFHTVIKHRVKQYQLLARQIG